MGDSAGANLVLGLVSHLMHPHPKIPPISLSSEQLSGVILISPWVTFSASAPSWTTNAYTDMLTKPIIARCQRKFLGKAFKDRYNEPLSADTTWWEKVPASTITLFYGTYEVFADDCRTVGERIKVSDTHDVFSNNDMLEDETNAHYRRSTRRLKWSAWRMRYTVRA